MFLEFAHKSYFYMMFFKLHMIFYVNLVNIVQKLVKKHFMGVYKEYLNIRFFKKKLLGRKRILG